MTNSDFVTLIDLLYDFIELYEVNISDRRYLYLVTTIGIVEHMHFKEIDIDNDINKVNHD